MASVSSDSARYEADKVIQVQVSVRVLRTPLVITIPPVLHSQLDVYYNICYSYQEVKRRIFGTPKEESFFGNGGH